MARALRGILSVVGRVALTAIFVSAALGQKIPNFNGVVQYMEAHNVPAPRLLLPGAIAFLLLGGASIILGYRARIGALLLLVFLIPTTYYFHDFWHLTGQEAEAQTIHFMKNLSMAGAMLFIIANGSGAWSLDGRNAAAKTSVVGAAPTGPRADASITNP